MASKMSRKAEITFDWENVYINKKAIIF
jgi:hypothetical protein